MAGDDNIVFNTRERPLSTDQNNLQALTARSRADSLAAMLADSDTGARRDMVLGGLLVTANGTNVDISAGVLVQESATIPVAPGALDSNYRFGTTRSTTTLAAPSPVGDTFYLLQAQVSNIVALNENRDVLDPNTGNFVPTPVDKRVERRITFSFKTGTVSVVPVADADNIPIAAIFRPGGGGAVSAADIRDMRPLWVQATREIEGGTPQQRVESYYMDLTQQSNTSAQFDFSGYIDEVIEPAQTRTKLIAALRLLRNKRDTNPPKKHGNIPL